MTREETSLLFNHLERSRSIFREAISGLTSEQFRFVPAKGGWSIGNCAEHVTLVESAVLQRLSAAIAANPNPPDPETPPKLPDELMLKMVSARANTVEAPESVRPASRFADAATLYRHFEEVRAALVAFAGAAPSNLRSYFSPHPNFQMIDGYQWLLVASGHCERHAKQIGGIKLDPNFPV